MKAFFKLILLLVISFVIIYSLKDTPLVKNYISSKTEVIEQVMGSGNVSQLKQIVSEIGGKSIPTNTLTSTGLNEGITETSKSVSEILDKSNISTSSIKLLNTTQSSFSTSKTILQKKVYNGIIGQRIDKYCGCTYNSSNKIVAEQCGFKSTGNYGNRTNIIEWEHMVPAERFGSLFTEWTKGDKSCVDSKGVSYKGRECAEKVNKTYQYMQADLHNLVPVIGEVNAIRSNYSYGIVTTPTKDFGKCDSKYSSKLFEPRDQMKGWVARDSLYMNDYIGGKLFTTKEKLLFLQWNSKYPVTKEECDVNNAIKQIQGNDNPYQTEKCKVLKF